MTTNHSLSHCNSKSRESTYVLTNDLGERIAGLGYLGIKVPAPNDQIFSDFHRQIKNKLVSMLPGVKVVSYDMKQMVEEVWAEAVRARDLIKNAIVVSSCAEVANVRRGHTIEINRIANQHGEVIGLGPRPGHPSLDCQLNSIASIADGNPVVLVEDGIFTGSTICYLMNEFAARRVRVNSIITGFSFPRATEKIKKLGVSEVITIKEIGIPCEWMPDHDFIPFAPNCGRVFGGKFGQQIMPHYSHDGVSFSFPYILPFGDPVKWASIPGDHAVSFSLYCVQTALELFRRIDEMNGSRITVHDLSGSTPRVSVPATIGDGQLPNADFAVSSFLSDVCHELT